MSSKTNKKSSESKTADSDNKNAPAPVSAAAPAPSSLRPPQPPLIRRPNLTVDTTQFASTSALEESPASVESDSESFPLGSSSSSASAGILSSSASASKDTPSFSNPITVATRTPPISSTASSALGNINATAASIINDINTALGQIKTIVAAKGGADAAVIAALGQLSNTIQVTPAGSSSAAGVPAPATESTALGGPPPALGAIASASGGPPPATGASSDDVQSGEAPHPYTSPADFTKDIKLDDEGFFKSTTRAGPNDVPTLLRYLRILLLKMILPNANADAIIAPLSKKGVFIESHDTTLKLRYDEVLADNIPTTDATEELAALITELNAFVETSKIKTGQPLIILFHEFSTHIYHTLYYLARDRETIAKTPVTPNRDRNITNLNSIIEHLHICIRKVRVITDNKVYGGKSPKPLRRSRKQNKKADSDEEDAAKVSD
jgi:hypothetical protein